MIARLHLENLGPTPKMDVDLARRVNILTGDNGLGKTLLLDVAWYSLTRTWAENRQTLPNYGAPKPAIIECAVRGANRKVSTISSTYDRKRQDWRVSMGKPIKPGLIVYARIDGVFPSGIPRATTAEGRKIPPTTMPVKRYI